MAEPIANPEALATLSAMVNQTLVESGRFFRSSGSMQARNQLKRNLPSTHEEFQCALDTLSEQIFIAKAFLEQDYEAAKEKRKALNPPPPEPVEEPKASEDTVMKDTPTAANGEDPTKKAEEPSPNDQLFAEPSGFHPLPPDDKAPDIPGPAKKAPSDKQEPPVPTTDDATGAPSTDPPPPGDSTGMNFDSMFPADSGQDGNIDLTMEFPSDEAGDQNFLAGFSVGDGQNKSNQDSMGSLLPGLENYANASGELNMNPPATTDPAQVSPTRQDSLNNAPPGESSFDDLFMDAGNFGGSGGDDDLLNGDSLQIGDLDASWLD